MKYEHPSQIQGQGSRIIYVNESLFELPNTSDAFYPYSTLIRMDLLPLQD